MPDPQERPSPVWIAEYTVLAIQQKQLAEHGGSRGIRDAGLLASALAHPRNVWAYGKADVDLATLASAYAFHLMQNHPFVDGNKRTAYVVCRTFLRLNGHDMAATREEKYRTFLELARGERDERDLATWIQDHLVEYRP